MTGYPAFQDTRPAVVAAAVHAQQPVGETTIH